MIRGAVFDLDGTLLDSNPYWGKAPAVYLASLGREAEPDIAETVFSMTVPEATGYMIRHYDLAVSPEEVAAGIDAIMESFYRYKIPMKDGVPALLGTCKERGIPCAIASVSASGNTNRMYTSGQRPASAAACRKRWSSRTRCMRWKPRKERASGPSASSTVRWKGTRKR